MAFIKDIPLDDRPREKLLQHSVSSLSNSELLAILLGSGYGEKSALHLAYDILRTYSLRKLSRTTLRELLNIQGIGMSKGSSILAAFELGRRMLSEQRQEKESISQVSDAVNIFQRLIGDCEQEMLAAIYLDARNNVLSKKIIFVGSVNESIIHPREIFRLAFEERACAVIISHNHPSGDTTPSKEDICVTKKIQQSAEICDIEFLDHIIIASGQYYSFAENKCL